MAHEGTCFRSHSGSCCCSSSGSSSHSKRGIAGMFCKVKEVEVVEINVELGNVKLNSHIKLIVLVGLVLDSATSVIKIVIVVKLLWIVEKVVMQDGGLELFESRLDAGDISCVSVGCLVADVGNNFVHDDFVDMGFEDNRGCSSVDKVIKREIKSKDSNPEIMKVKVSLVFLVGDVDTVKS